MSGRKPPPNPRSAGTGEISETSRSLSPSLRYFIGIRSARWRNSWLRMGSHISSGQVRSLIVFEPAESRPWSFSGYASDIEHEGGRVDAFAENLAMLSRLFGHGSSGGRTEEGALIRWSKALAIVISYGQSMVISVRRWAAGLRFILRCFGRAVRAEVGAAARTSPVRASRRSRRTHGEGRVTRGFWNRARSCSSSISRLPSIAGAPAPWRARRRGAAGCIPSHARASFSRCPAGCAQGRRPPLSEPHEIDDPADRHRLAGASILILCSPAPLAYAPPAGEH